MSDLLKTIDRLFGDEEIAADRSGALTALARRLEGSSPALLVMASADGTVEAADALDPAVPLAAAADVAAALRTRLADAPICLFSHELSGRPYRAVGTRLGGSAQGGLLGGLFGPCAGPMPTERIVSVLADGGEPAWMAVHMERAAEGMRTQIRHLEAEHETLRTAHAEALGHAIEEHEKRLREEREKAAMEQACLANQAANRAKSQFLANMSHEIRTPLNAILGFTELLRKGADAGDEAARNEYLDIIYTSGSHLLELINDILDLSKIEAGRLQIERIRCSLHEIVADVMSLLRVRAREKGLAFRCEWPDGAPAQVQTDPLRLKQLLVNLLGNAVKFTRAGEVRLVVRLLPRPSGTMLCFQIIDSGIGIAPEKLEFVFDAFSQADSSITREFGGTGLGLAISRQIACALGGDITVQSELGKGSVFAVTIDPGPLDGVPILAGPPSDGVSRLDPSRAGPQTALPPARILVVDDGNTNRRLIGLMLSRAGATVLTAENGEVAVAMAAQEPFDAILMDMQMPVLDGYSAARKLREMGNTAPIIALTAHAMAGDEKKCLAAGCTGYLTKPIQSDRLIERLRQVLPPSGTQPAASGAQSAASPAPPPASPEAEPLVSSLPADDPDFREIIGEFIEIFHQKLSAMEEALAREDLDDLAALAHWLKGSGGTAGFDTLTLSAKRIEQLAKQHQRAPLEGALQDLRELAARIVAPSAFLASPQAPPSGAAPGEVSKASGLVGTCSFAGRSPYGTDP